MKIPCRCHSCVFGKNQQRFPPMAAKRSRAARAACALVLSVLLGGCTSKHYAVCVSFNGDAGCSHQRFNLATSKVVARLLASEPSDGEKQVWIEDMRKKPANATISLPSPSEQPVRKPVESTDKL